MSQAFGSIQSISVVAAPHCTSETKYGVLILGSLLGNIAFEDKDVPFVQTLANPITLTIDRSRFKGEVSMAEASEHAERSRAEAIATHSHELRTPLAAF